MRSTTALATLAIATGLPLAAAAAPAHAETTTEREKGVLVECAGTWRTRPVTVSVYEHRTYGNEVLVAIGAEDGRFVSNTDISTFIRALPLGITPKSFSSQDASGSASQAANIVEALQLGAGE